MSFSPPSYVSATTGSAPPGGSASCLICHAMIASRTTPTLCVFVIPTGPSRNPLSCTHVVPVISPLPFSANHPANTGSGFLLPRGKMTVTPVRTGPGADDGLAAPVDDRGGADLDARDIGDRVERAGRSPDGDRQFARPRLRLRGGAKAEQEQRGSEPAAHDEIPQTRVSTRGP